MNFLLKDTTKFLAVPDTPSYIHSVLENMYVQHRSDCERSSEDRCGTDLEPSAPRHAQVGWIRAGVRHGYVMINL